MKKLLMNIYGDTLKKICLDLITQIEDYEGDEEEVDVDDKKSLKKLKKLIKLYWLEEELEYLLFKI